MKDVFTTLIKESSILTILSDILIAIVLLVAFAYAIYFLYKSYQQSFKESKIDKLLGENKQLQQHANYLDAIITAETELHENFYVQSNIIEQILSSSQSDKPDLRNQLREFLDNFVMVAASINTFHKKRSKIRIIIWKQENDSKIQSYVISSNYTNKETHTLDIKNSIVGRALRTQTAQTVLNTNDDPEWNETSKKTYTAVIAKPLSEQYTDGHFIISFDFVNTDSEFVSYLNRNALLIEQLLIKIILSNELQELQDNINSITASYGYDDDDDDDFMPF